MDRIKDPILSQQVSASLQGEDLKVTLLREEQIREVAAYVQLIWDLSQYKAKYKRFYTVREVIDDTIEVLKDTNRQFEKFWIAKTAAIIREVVDNHFEQNAKQYLKCLPNRRNNQSAEDMYVLIGELKNIINDITHIRYDNAIMAINSSNNIKDLFGINSQIDGIDKKILDLLVFHLINLLYQLFQYCKRT